MTSQLLSNESPIPGEQSRNASSRCAGNGLDERKAKDVQRIRANG